VEELSEKEQLEVMRQWWRENGNYVISGVVLGIALLVGWNQWQGGIAEAEVQASALYESVVIDVAGGKLESAESTAEELYAGYESTTYPGQARLAMARLYMDKGRDQDAADTLQGLLDSPAGELVKNIGRLRLARILLYQDKPQEVIDLLSGDNAEAFRARYSEVLGDAYFALEKYDDAADAYEVALADDRQTSTVDLTLVQMKMNDLPEEGALPAIDESLGIDSGNNVDEVAEENAPVAAEQEEVDIAETEQ
jgi:predicted negative regulator of RcsB-dependent stress response